MDTKEAGTLPLYGDILQEIGAQLKARKGLLLKRIFLIYWPLFILVAFCYVGIKTGLINENNLYSATLFIPVVSWVILGGIYQLVMSIIFAIEKNIWIDSYFDKKNISPADSWRISRKLFWPAIRFGLQMAAKFYVLPLIIFTLVVIAAFISIGSISNINPILAFAITLSAIFAPFVYFYYLQIKLRYAQFLFLDMYGSDNFSSGQLFREMEKLNDITKSDSFKKALVSSLGTDVVGTIVQSSVRAISQGMGALGSVGQALGVATKTIGEQYVKEATSYGKISAFYILYRFARKELYGEDQKINEHIYSL